MSENKTPKKKRSKVEPSINQSELKVENKNHIMFNELIVKTYPEIFALAQELEIDDPFSFKINELITNIIKKYMEKNFIVMADGILEIMNDGFGFLRFSEINYRSTKFDIFVPGQKIRKWNLKSGDSIKA